METANVYRLNRDPMSANQPVPSASVAERAPKPKLLDQVRHVIRTRHYSYMTESLRRMDQEIHLLSQQTPSGRDG